MTADDQGSPDDLADVEASAESVALTEAGREAALPAELAHLSWMIGSWSGVGLGQYPTIEDFRFHQDLTISTDGRPFLQYVSRSWVIDDDGNRVRPSASETGYLRPRPDNEVEFLLVHPTGITEIWFGKVEVTSIVNAVITGARIRLLTDGVMRTPSAKEVSGGERLYGLVDGDLLWTYDMAAMGQPLSNHLSARLRPVT